MSITQTYYLAHTARGKLAHEAARPDHKLRFLVGHANMLDSLMLELSAAEQEQESWFNASIRGAEKKEDKHIRWADAIVEEPEQDWEVEDTEMSDDSSDSDSEFDEEEDERIRTAGFTTLHRVNSRTNLATPQQAYEQDSDEEEYEDDGEEDYAMLSLTRTASHPAPGSPPELAHDSEDESSDDDSMPPSPPTTALPSFSTKQRPQEPAQKDYYMGQSQRLVTAISVY
jgi:hypothetical protein